MADEPGPARQDADAAYQRLNLAYQDIREQFAATSEILTALGRAGADPGVILDTIVERAASLCGADAAQLYLLQDGVFSISRVSGRGMEEYARYWREHPSTLNRASLVGRVALERRSQQIDDVLDDPEYGRLDLQRLVGFRSMLYTPMIVDDEVVGVLGVWRTKVSPFDGRALELLGVFAAQAAIVVENVDLVRALESRSAELATKAEQLEALREVGEAVSSSLNLDDVLQEIVENAVHLTDTDGGSIMEYNADDDSFEVRTAFGSSDELIEQLRAIKIRRESTLVGRAALDRRPLEVADLAAGPLDPHLQILYDDGWRSVLAVPMLRQDQMVGALVIRRRTTGHFDPDTLELLQTFAGQSALAILNARLFRALEQQSAELEVVSRHKSEFLASMSHELRTPLNAVIGFSEVLLDQLFGEINQKQEEYLQDIRNSGLHLLELLNEILDLSKVEAGRMQLEPAVFSVKDALDYTLSMVRERAVRHGITLTLDVAPEVGEIETDPLRLKQVALNLLSNAVKFTPDGGRVDISATIDGEELRISVTDTGAGVPPEDRDRIFESFQQGGRGTTKEEGTGLGLTLSRRLVELLGGRMWLETIVGEGSTFGFAIPTGNLLPEQRRPDRAGAATPQVLMVDDDRASLDLAAAYLTGSGVELVRARDGHEALELARRLRPAAVVLDIRLPRLDGWQVLSELKSDPATEGIPVVIVSIVDEPARGLGLGAAAYLTKPVRRDDLLAALRRVGVLGETTPSLVAEGAEQ